MTIKSDIKYLRKEKEITTPKKKSNLKDWKEVEKNEWRNKKRNGFVKIQKHKDGWITYAGKYPLITPELDVLSRTKPQALSFAKQYMKKN